MMICLAVTVRHSVEETYVRTDELLKSTLFVTQDIHLLNEKIQNRSKYTSSRQSNGKRNINELCSDSIVLAPVTQ